MTQRPPTPPFTQPTAVEKVQLAENAWNGRDPEKIAQAYSPMSAWRNRAEIFTGRTEIIKFLKRKWTIEHDYRLIKELWAYAGDRIAVRFAYEWHNDANQWFRSYGNENWQFDGQGLMVQRIASINDLEISESERQFHWNSATRPSGHPGLSDLGL